VLEISRRQVIYLHTENGNSAVPTSKQKRFGKMKFQEEIFIYLFIQYQAILRHFLNLKPQGRELNEDFHN
jgi:hypothetical protein